MNETIKTKVTILLNLVNSGKSPDEAAKLIGYKHYDSMRASVGIENGCDLYESIKAGVPVEWSKKKFRHRNKPAEDIQMKALREDYEILKREYESVRQDNETIFQAYQNLIKKQNTLVDELTAAIKKFIGTGKENGADEE